MVSIIFWYMVKNSFMINWECRCSSLYFFIIQYFGENYKRFAEKMKLAMKWFL